MAIFVLSNQSSGSEMAQQVEGFFCLPFTIWRWLVYIPETGDPEQGFDSVDGHRFLFGLMSKTCLS